MVDLSVVICTYNGAERIPKVLNHLAAQINTSEFIWEVVVVDNNSTDNTATTVQALQEQWMSNTELRYVFESKQGLAFARSRAMQEAKGDLVAFVDDDNLLFANWLSEAYKFAQEHPQSGAFGGQIHGKFNTAPPPYLKNIKIFLAIIEKGKIAFQYTPEKRMLPPGAGLVVRKKAWFEHVPSSLSLKGRNAQSLMAGEDLEALVNIQKGGWEIWYNPAMELYHDIPKHRLSEQYLLRLAWGTGLCRHHIRMGRYSIKDKIFLTPLHVINDFWGLSSYFLTGQFRFHHKFMIKFETIYRLSTFLSTFYYLREQVNLFIGKASEQFTDNVK